MKGEVVLIIRSINKKKGKKHTDKKEKETKETREVEEERKDGKTREEKGGDGDVRVGDRHEVMVAPLKLPAKSIQGLGMKTITIFPENILVNMLIIS